MSLTIPSTHQEHEALHQHEEQQHRHEETIAENERHMRDDKAYREMCEATEDERARIGYEEKAARRQQDVDTAALTEEYNTALRNEETTS